MSDEPRSFGLVDLALLGLVMVWGANFARLGSARTAIHSYLTPLVAVVVAWIFLGESMQPLQALGAVGILVGVALGRYRPQR